jgi:general secretion pathway protein L
MQTRLIFLSASGDQPSPFLVVDRAGAIVQRGALTVDTSPTLFKGRTVLVVPGTEVVTHWLDLGAGPQSRLVEAAAVLLKDQISAPRDDIHIALGEQEGDGLRAVSVVDRTVMQDFLDRASELGISPDIVVPDHLLLPPPEEGVIAVTLGSIVAVRGAGVAFSAETELASVLIGTRPRASIERVSEIEALFAVASMRPLTNLLQQDFVMGSRGKSIWNGYRRVAALAVVAALSPLAVWTAEIVRNEAAARGLEARAEATARAVIGDSRSSDAIGQLRGRVAELGADESFIQATAALFEAVSRTQGVELENLSYLQDGVLRATLIHGAASDLGGLRGVLEQSGISLDEDAAQERDGRMATTITLNRRP